MKTVFLKQYFIVEEPHDGKTTEKRLGAFILNTCAQTARREFQERFGRKIGLCVQSAVSERTKEFLDSHDMWAEKLNWTVELEPQIENDRQKKYESLKKSAVEAQKLV